MDVHDKATRSFNMSRIRSKNTKPEEIVRKYLFAEGFRYRKNVKGLPGTPDIVLRKYKAAIFVNGCFWHKHSCKYFVEPSSNTEFWISKLEQNVKSDIGNYLELTNAGWNVIIVWECELKKNNLINTLNDLKQKIALRGSRV